MGKIKQENEVEVGGLFIPEDVWRRFRLEQKRRGISFREDLLTEILKERYDGEDISFETQGNLDSRGSEKSQDREENNEKADGPLGQSVRPDAQE